MMGGMLAGHDQSGGEGVVKQNGTKVKLFYGMSSATAMQKHSGGVAEYRWAANKMMFHIYRVSPCSGPARARRWRCRTAAT